MERENERWNIIIEPRRNLLDFKLKQLYNYWDLLIMFVKKDITVNYKQTILGPIWFFIQPIMTTLIFMFVFGNIAGISTDGLPQPLFYMAGTVIWNYFSECLVKTSDTFTQNAGVYGKVYFPRLITPLSVIVSNGLKFLIQFSLFVILYIYFFLFKNTNIQPQIEIILFPILLTIMAFLGLGLGLIFSSLTTKYRDLQFLIQFGVQLLMYATPIIYPLSSISDRYRFYVELNPITHIIETFKYIFLGVGQYSVIGISYSFLVTFITLFLGIILFNKTEQTFIDIV